VGFLRKRDEESPGEPMSLGFICKLDEDSPGAADELRSHLQVRWRIAGRRRWNL